MNFLSNPLAAQARYLRTPAIEALLAAGFADERQRPAREVAADYAVTVPGRLEDLLPAVTWFDGK
ncbi:MAG: hypothetical protein ACR2I0_04075 [Rhodoferax sp.]